MPMSNNGLDKMVEEFGEVLKDVGKLNALGGDLDRPHWDGKGAMRERLQSELGDATGAVNFVIDKLGLDRDAVLARSIEKQDLFAQWDKEVIDDNRGYGGYGGYSERW